MYQEVFQLHASLLKALAHPKRLEIVHLLREEALTVTEIQRMLGLGQANLSQHLQVLREAGVVRAERNGKQKRYRLAHRNFAKASDLLRTVLIERHADEPLADELSKRMRDFLPIVQDVVCGMRLSPRTAGFARAFNGKRYYFCATGCLQTFRLNPQRYV
ncbi:MAG: metalloregulator ArsR/SmtB family transcription factor [Candidatus Kerfeldbacteria bacterium]|nr:metalloregulator ArsR/SmtB family transcription factor [Candidatus Kerfeldbacteria bacterium]